MAEGFAKVYGADVMDVQSAGLAPALSIAPLTHKVMLEKNIDLGNCYPKSLDMLADPVDLIINMSGKDIPRNPAVQVEEWLVRDPIGEPEEVYREVRDHIEQRVMRLVLAMRARKPPQTARSGAGVESRVDTRQRPPRK
jgi:arsenate reductase (thioredoxin)